MIDILGVGMPADPTGTFHPYFHVSILTSEGRETPRVTSHAHRWRGKRTPVAPLAAQGHCHRRDRVGYSEGNCAAVGPFP